MPLVDLSAPIVSTPEGTPAPLAVRVTHSSHAEGAATIAQLFGVPSSLLRHGEGWAVEELVLGTHNATSTRPGTTTRRSAASGPRRSTSCRWSGSSARASCSI